ncbi:MAG: YbgA family protein [Candidatus Caldatribacteriaceae bacterium]
MKPKVVVSQCLGFEACRYDGSIIPSTIVERLKEEVTFIPVCPEVSIGLGIPRPPIRIVAIDNIPRLIQEETQQDLTEAMLAFSKSFLQKPDIHGFILKSKSPSCGIRDVKLYSFQGSVLSTRENGFFAQSAFTYHPHAAIETEKRLLNAAIYEHFLQKIFALSAFSMVKSKGEIKDLVDFHTRYKLFLMAHHQRETQTLGKIVANHRKNNISTVFKEYELHLHQALKRGINRKLTVNVLYHALGYFKETLHPREKQFFLQLVDQFKEGRVPLIVLTSLARSWIERFGEEYLAQQVFFTPYPEKIKPQIYDDILPSRNYWDWENQERT